MASRLGSMRGAYLLARTLHRWSAEELAGWVASAAASGIDTVVTKVEAVTPGLSALCWDNGMTVLGSFTCFSDHADPVRAREHLRPVDEHGHRFRAMEWYTGLIPTDEAYNDDLVRRCRDAAAVPGIAGIILDFVRWPCHWELELRPGASPRRGSFDPVTLRAFRDYLDRHGRAVGHRLDPDDPVAAARVIAADLADSWTAFRCDVIVEIATRLTAAVRGEGLLTGAFVVPAGPDELRRVLGQDVARLGSLVDVVLPMTYHAIMMRDAAWPRTIVDSLQSQTTAPVVPMLQTTADRELSGGYDWGPAVTPGDFRAALAATGPAGYCVFPGEGLDAAELEILARTDSFRNNARKPIRGEANAR